MLICKHMRRVKLSIAFFSSSPSRVLIVFYHIALTLNLVKMVLSGGGVDHCYSDIGCFPLSAEFFHPRHRPFNVRPWHRNLIKTQFELFNRQHPEGFMLIPWNKFNLERSGFNPRLETKIIIPGWLDNINRALWVRKMKDALLWLWAPVNIIVVRWRNFTPYTIATANTRVVGAELANVLKFIEHEMDYDRAYYHVIGHSLGAHIAGYCGDRIHGLGRITALDPARPFFQGMPKSVRLDRADAKFVDAIHSDFTPENAIFLLMSYGMTTPVGHLDFYPNGPPLFQPGCLRDTLTSVQDGIARGLEHNSLSIAFLESVRYLTACDHQRSHEWFLESITNRECTFVGVRCNEFEGMINGRCTCDDSPSACAIMGIHADQMYANNVHEELWPVRAGSIDYKYNSAAANGRRPPPPIVSAPPPLAPHYSPHYSAPGLAGPAHELETAGLAPLPNPLALAHLLAQTAEEAQAAPATKEEIYARLKQQASQLQRPPEPAIVGHVDPATAAAAAAMLSYTDEAPPLPGAEDMDVQASEQVMLQQQVAALDDLAFVQYLKASLLSSQLDTISTISRAVAQDGRAANSSTQEAAARPDAQRRNDNTTQGASSRLGEQDDGHSSDTREHQDHQDHLEQGQQSGRHSRASSHPLGHPRQYDGHPLLLSDLHRDIESWYEDNSKWFLKTNNQPRYCSNQYQLLIFLGPLNTRNGRDSLRANLLVSIIGTRGQLLNQRFVPRGSTLNSFTMQPFFILLEGSYSLGQIKSIAIAWERRTDPDPVQATIKFQSNLLDALGSQVPAYQAKHNPWMPEHSKYDKSEGFSSPHNHRQRAAAAPQSSPAASSSLAASSASLAASATNLLLKSNIRGHYSDKYERRDGSSPNVFGRRSDLQVAPTKGSLTCCDERERAEPTTGVRIKRDAADLKVAEANQELDYEQADEAGDTEEADEVEVVAQPAAAEQPAMADQLTAPSLLMTQMAAAQQANMIAQHQQQQQQQQQQLDSLDQAASSDALFVPLVDLPYPAERVRPLAVGAALGDLDQDSGEKITMDLHNIDLQHDERGEDSIVINQVIVSPLQAYYGHHGRTAKAFCPPRSRRILLQDKTVRLTPALVGKCH